MTKQAVTELLAFINASPSPFHAVATSTKLLLSAGFTELKESQTFTNKLSPSGKYFYTRNQSSLVAFTIGAQYKRGNGFSIVGAHTDSPCLKVKPVSVKEAVGCVQVGVELYGGGLWHTWFDRDLGIAGRVFVETTKGHFEARLVKIHRIPTLAIHLDRSVNEGFTFNKETHLTPILAQAVKPLNKANTVEAGEKEKHSSVLLDLIAAELGVATSAIGEFELCLYDCNSACSGGANNEFIFASRLDNLCMSFCSLTALIKSVENLDALKDEQCIRIVALFDNEEVGSQSCAGADSNLLQTCLKRLAETPINGETEDVASRRNVLAQITPHLGRYGPRLPSKLYTPSSLSYQYLDQEKHEQNHRPLMNKGVVIKQNANQRYATTSTSTLILRECAKMHGTPLQEFVVRNDSACGSTIGPMLSAKLGMRCIDIGNPQLSMHSIREQCGSEDILHAINLFQSFFTNFATIDSKITVD